MAGKQPQLCLFFRQSPVKMHPGLNNLGNNDLKTPYKNIALHALGTRPMISSILSNGTSLDTSQPAQADLNSRHTTHIIFCLNTSKSHNSFPPYLYPVPPRDCKFFISILPCIWSWSTDAGLAVPGPVQTRDSPHPRGHSLSSEGKGCLKPKQCILL